MPKNTQYRNYDENIYLSLAIRKNSKVYERLMADADRVGIKRRKLHDLIVTRLSDYYDLTEGEGHDDAKAAR